MIRRYQSKNMEMEIIGPESFLNLAFKNCTISAVMKFKTFLRPLTQKEHNLTHSLGLKFVEIDLRHFKDF